MRRLGEDRAGEIRLTRFLRNGSVTTEEMVTQAALETERRCAGRPVLVLQDTTVVRSGGGGGLYLHPALAVDAEDGSILGLTHAVFLSRTTGKKADRRSKPIEEKESWRWIEAAERSARVCSSAASLTVIGDRENDIFQAFARCPEGTDLVVRAAHDRALEDGGLLFAELDAQPVAGRTELDLPAGPGRRARRAGLTVRVMRAALARPANGLREGMPKTLEVTVVDLREETPPVGQAPVHWRLLTTLLARDLPQVLAIADLYRRRWAIEQLFRTLKTQGFDIEGLGIEEEAPLRRLVMAALIAAITIQQLVHARDGQPGAQGALRPLSDAFEPQDRPLLEAFCAKLEGKTERQKNPHPRGSLAYAAWVCARLGGWTGYYGKPGPMVMLEGWLFFQAAKQGANLTHTIGDV